MNNIMSLDAASTLTIIFISLIVIIGLIVGLVFIVKGIQDKINYYPQKVISVDISNKPKMDNNDCLDYYIINFGYEELQKHTHLINEWKKEKLEKVKNNKNKTDKLIKSWRKNCNKAFFFKFYRQKTKYRQQNYVKSSYIEDVISNSFICSDSFVMDRVRFLVSQHLDVTYNQYNKVDQRKALTKELREHIKKRDNYTCQICGKYMPDEVGLHIDHIIPIAKGGKSVPSNLRVLCSKCNGRKGAK